MAGFESRGKVSLAGAKARHADGDLISLSRLVEARRFPEIESAARRILATRPNQPFVLKALSYALLSSGRESEALPFLKMAVALTPRDAELHNNLGIAQCAALEWSASVASFAEAEKLAPDDPEIPKNMGVALARTRRWADSVPCFLRAIEKHPGDYPEAVELLASSLFNAGRITDAQLCFTELLAVNPKLAHANYMIATIKLRRCDWSGLDELLGNLRAVSEDFSRPIEGAWFSFSFPGVTAAEQRMIAETHAREMLPVSLLEADVSDVSPRAEAGRLVIGYLSADFRDHAVAHCLIEVLERHDRSKFVVKGFSTRTAEPSELSVRLERAFDEFVSIEALSLRDAAEAITQAKVDILIDLTGWTAYGRPEVLALRPAPIQVNWLGYAGTLGFVRLADYVIGDPVATPLSAANDFAEAMVQLPDCYLPTDTTRQIPEPMSRGEAGLPETAFVFCSFNNAYKFNPGMFDIWCKLLSEKPNSLLWLSDPGDSARQSLMAEASARGVAPDRLIFAPRENDHARYLARIAAADLALDTSPYNSHSTGLDTLWAGVPMVTLAGSTFPARVGASLLAAAGLSDLIASSLDEYFALARDLARDRDRLAAIRARLTADRRALPLFDMAKFTRNLERAYTSMKSDRMAGLRRPIILGAD